MEIRLYTWICWLSFIILPSINIRSIMSNDFTREMTEKRYAKVHTSRNPRSLRNNLIILAFSSHFDIFESIFCLAIASWTFQTLHTEHFQYKIHSNTIESVWMNAGIYTPSRRIHSSDYIWLGRPFQYFDLSFTSLITDYQFNPITSLRYNFKISYRWCAISLWGFCFVNSVHQIIYCAWKIMGNWKKQKYTRNENTIRLNSVDTRIQLEILK